MTRFVATLVPLLVCIAAAAASTHGNGKIAFAASRAAEGAVVCSSYLNVPRESTPLASRDGRTLVWTQTDFRRPTSFIYAAGPNATGARRVVPERVLLDSIAVAPDGSEVLYGTHDRFEPGWVPASTQASTRRPVRADEMREIRRRWRTPEWSPDGRYFVEASSDGVWITLADDGSRRRISSLPWSSQAAWSPDGAQIAFSSEADHVPNNELYVVNVDGGGLRRLTRNGEVFNPAWSPDGRWIAFTQDISTYHEGSRIGVVRPDGSGLRFLTRRLEGPDQRSAGFVSWLDGTRLVFVSWERRAGRRKVQGIHTIGVDGRNERRMTYHCHLGTPGNDTLRGSLLGDTMRSFAGADEVIPGAGLDDVESGAGADVIRSRDGLRDSVRCGRGRDTVFADGDDVVRDCERVRRR